MHYVKRRDFITLLGGAAAAWPLAARAQQPAMPVIGFLGSATADAFAAYVTAFHRGLGEIGYVEGRNVSIEYRWAEGQYDRMPALVADFLRRQTVVIAVTGSTAAVQAAKAATQTIPIVFVIGADPVKFDLVPSFNRPSGNVTGISFLVNLLVAKQIEVLHELIPAAAVVGFLVNPNNPNAESDTSRARIAADTLGHSLVVVSARTDDEVDGAFAIFTQKRVNALLVSPDPLFVGRRDGIVALARRHALPAMYNSREYASAGGLLSYGPDQADAYRQAGLYVGRILKGESPADLPIVQPTKFELIINLKTAKALGIEIPPMLLARANEVIE
jgi:putative tryptophan/tyrosine transport system substrate-binding protein